MTTKTKVKTIRESLIDVIVEYSGDEFESKQDYLVLAKESEIELLNRVVNIIDYYKNN